jgi:hypothetical protein
VQIYSKPAELLHSKLNYCGYFYFKGYNVEYDKAPLTYEKQADLLILKGLIDI